MQMTDKVENLVSSANDCDNDLQAVLIDFGFDFDLVLVLYPIPDTGPYSIETFAVFANNNNNMATAATTINNIDRFADKNQGKMVQSVAYYLHLHVYCIVIVNNNNHNNSNNMNGAN